MAEPDRCLGMAWHAPPDAVPGLRTAACDEVNWQVRSRVMPCPCHGTVCNAHGMPCHAMKCNTNATAPPPGMRNMG